MSKLIALLTLAAIASGGCGDTTTTTESTASGSEAATIASPLPSSEVTPSMEIQDGRVAGLQRMKAVLDDLDWRCDEEDGIKVRSSAIRLRSTLAIFQRVCRDAVDGNHTEQQRARVTELADQVRAKIASCERLGGGDVPKSSTELCDVSVGGNVR